MEGQAAVNDRIGGILHADLDAFYASVEQRDDPRLRGRPVIVGGGVVLAGSYEARARGVRTAMGGRQALRLCPDAIVVPPRFDAYVEASRAVFDIFRDTTPLVRALSIDEAFLDVSGLRRLRGPALPIARELRRRVQAEVGLPISVGIARTQYLAKVASALAKPDGLLVVPTDGELQFLHALPVERLWGVGDVTAAKLHAARLRTVADVARQTPGELAAIVGRAAGHHLHALATGHDPRRVESAPARRSIGAQHALGGGKATFAEADLALLALCDKVGRRLRRAGRAASTVTVRLRFGDFRRSTSSRTLPRPTESTSVVSEVARALLRARQDEIERDRITLVGVALSGLDDHGTQLALPLDGEADPALDQTLDLVAQRFGTAAVRRGSHLGRGWEPRSPVQ
ncbi:DNA polymerase IV [Aeromicrobium flavum]|uniref:DNA polymerase IV n=1 Tax=Aeromicrobium flavum TaxID=416568 RepID=A0A512HVM2_9ACTN|nr:DNA polymerase IV [Aeromicrobium flavum]GEO89506.1 DNA polymerase IV [Aeromicrobium flavum]